MDVLPPVDLRAFIDMYSGQMNERLVRVRLLAAYGALPELAREAHTIIGSAGAFGAMRLVGLAREVEAACVAGASPGEIGTRVRRLDAEARAVSVKLRIWCDGSIASAA
jgi:HPt (histidine-containing phosphotransfer) domain-containing protein